MQLPLDLDDNCLAFSIDQLEAAVNQLDANGWNQNLSIRSAASSRALLLCDMVREDILELSLAALPQNSLGIAQYVCPTTNLQGSQR